MKKGHLVYIATPYSDPSHEKKCQRFDRVTSFAAELMMSGIYTYSPITHCHPMAMIGELPGTWEFWGEYDRRMISMCDLLAVYMQDGWEESTGVNAEINIAEELSIPVVFIDPADDGRWREA